MLFVIKKASIASILVDSMVIEVSYAADQIQGPKRKYNEYLYCFNMF